MLKEIIERLPMDKFVIQAGKWRIEGGDTIARTKVFCDNTVIDGIEKIEFVLDEKRSFYPEMIIIRRTEEIEDAEVR